MGYKPLGAHAVLAFGAGLVGRGPSDGKLLFLGHLWGDRLVDAELVLGRLGQRACTCLCNSTMEP